MNSKVFRSENPDVKESYIGIYDYCQKLESMVKSKEKEIIRLEQINRYLHMSQQRRDEMLVEHLAEI